MRAPRADNMKVHGELRESTATAGTVAHRLATTRTMSCGTALAGTAARKAEGGLKVGR